MTGIKRIGLPAVGVARSPDVDVVNSISKRMAGFGLIGAIGSVSGSVVRGNRSDAVVAMMAAQHLDPGPAMTEMLAAMLGAKGFTVVPLAADPKRMFLPNAAPTPECDAVLDCYIAQFGFIALNDDDDSPYRATVAMPVRLVGAGGAVLMLDRVVISADDAMSQPKPAAQTPLPAGVLAPGVFHSFSDVQNNPAVGTDALRMVFQAAAAGAVRRIT